MKTCIQCNVEQPITEFWKHGDFGDGVMSTCRECIKARRRAVQATRTTMNHGDKTCSKCERLLPIASFSLYSKAPDGRQWRCRDCHSVEQQDRRSARRVVGIIRDTPAEVYCPGCKETLPSTEFVGHIWRKNGLQPQCRLCQRVKKYGLTKSTWLDLLNAQNYQCASCEIELAVESTHQANSPHVDHDHATGDVRGILCAFCNAALGFVKDDPQILHGLIRYLGYASRTSQQEAETA